MCLCPPTWLAAKQCNIVPISTKHSVDSGSNHISHGQPRTSAQPHSAPRHLGPGPVSPPSLPTGGATWPHAAAQLRANSMTICFFSVYCLQIMELKFSITHGAQLRSSRVPAVVMTECGGVMIELICRKIFLWQTNKLYKHSSPHQSPVTTGQS